MEGERYVWVRILGQSMVVSTTEPSFVLAPISPARSSDKYQNCAKSLPEKKVPPMVVPRFSLFLLLVHLGTLSQKSDSQRQGHRYLYEVFLFLLDKLHI